MKTVFYDPMVRFWNTVDFISNSPCWTWIGKKTISGYGQFNLAGKRIHAHKYSYYCSYGNFDNKLLVCHTCDNRVCINPTHLFLGTHQDNMDDMKNKHRSARQCGEDHGMSKLTENDVIQIRSLYKNKKGTQKELAEKYHVHQSAICRIIKNKTWTKGK